MREMAFLRLVGMVALVMSGCADENGGTNTIQMPSSDSTSPSIALDIYDLPPPASNPESTDESCCAKTFVIPLNRNLTLVANGKDTDGGIRRTVIYFEVTRTCEDPLSDIGQRRRAFGISGDSPDQSSPHPTPGSKVKMSRIAQGPFRMADLAPNCLPEAPKTVSVSGEIWAEASNYFNLTSETKIVSLTEARYGPISVSNSQVKTGIQVEKGSAIRVQSEGFVDFGGAVVGLGAPILTADGDNATTPGDYPAPKLRKNSLVIRVGSTWYQGGVEEVFRPSESGELILQPNDRNLEDNSRSWEVSITILN